MKIKKLVISCKDENILEQITGQRPLPIFAKKSIANFAIREGQIMSFIVTLRRKRLEAFLERFFRVILPSQSRFQGFDASDAVKTKKLTQKNKVFTIGLPDCLAFLEIDNELKVGLNLSFFTSSAEPVDFNDFLKTYSDK